MTTLEYGTDSRLEININLSESPAKLFQPGLLYFQEKYGPVGLIHVDAHDDTAPDMFGEAVTHGTPFYHAGEEGCLDFTRCVQIGLRGTGYGPNDYAYARKRVSILVWNS